ncbi:hypothetical protein PACTADRAFT_36352, partial [Pachysolen tannophilus NRRL Y-2460]
MESHFTKIKTVLVANRGEIACRIIQSCKQLGLKSVSIFTKEDVDSLHVSSADVAVLIKGVGASAYLDIEQIVKVAKDHYCDVAVPGYGFLSENSDFAAALEKEGIVFAGPSPESVKLFGLKHFARDIASKNNVPIVPGSDLIEKESDVIECANKIGYPIMLKATAGG